ncbi:MAG: glucosamine-6-phosphate deaminase [Bacteroidota bacterium]
MDRTRWERSPSTRRELVHTEIFESPAEASRVVAEEIAALIRDKASRGEMCVLGLATGSTPKTVYAELIRMHQQEGLSFQNVITFNLDEYYPMTPDSLHSYVRFMKEHLFDSIDIRPENVHIPDGTLPADAVAEYCATYEQKIQDAGGLDIQILGIGRTGHIGFNEPGSTLTSPTRMVTLDHVTRVDAASDFFGMENVPRKALTMGIGTIMAAKRIILMAWGEGKAPIIQHAVEGSVSEEVPATFLQSHPNTTYVIDQAASAELSRIKTPWLFEPIQWTEEMTKKAVIWLGMKLEKPILKLTDREYMDHGMSDLILEQGPAYDINLRVFNKLQHTITGWPGGKPNADDTYRPERAEPARKRVILFSPHPDDDVISMGGTFIRLVDQGHEVHVAYQTSGNIAVFDDDVIRFADFFAELSQELGKKGELYDHVTEAIRSKKPGDVDSPEVARIKALIRRSEARAGARYVGLPDEQMHFLDMPFYETGKVKKKPLGEEDIQLIMNLIAEVKPHQIYAAGDLSDPHGTHRVCLAAILEACKRMKAEPYMKDCWLWLYRGAWQEYPLEEIDMAVPLSPSELMRKRKAVFKHQSQKDTALFPGNDSREFWQRAEDRNHGTARLYDLLGLPEYEAIEAFKRHEC